MNINSTLFLQCIVFLGLALFTMKFIWPPLIQALDERAQKIADGLAASEKGIREQQEAQANIADLVKEAKVQAADIVAQAQKRATELVEASKADAKEAGSKELLSAQAEISQLAQKARTELQSKVVSLSVLAAERIVNKEIDEKVHAQMLDDLVAQL